MAELVQDPAAPVATSARTTSVAAVRTSAGVAAALSAYAGAIHLYAAPEHLDAWWGYGLFFVGTGVAQLALAALLRWRPRWQVVALGIAANVAVLATYVVSRTRGVPVGPLHGGHRLEPAGTLDLAAAAAEVVLVVALAALLPAPARRVAVNGVLVLGLALWALRLTGTL